MTIVEYADLVAELRVWQQKHREGDHTAYAVVKRLEKKVDRATAAIRSQRVPTLLELIDEENAGWPAPVSR